MSEETKKAEQTEKEEKATELSEKNLEEVAGGRVPNQGGVRRTA